MKTTSLLTMSLILFSMSEGYAANQQCPTITNKDVNKMIKDEAKYNVFYDKDSSKAHMMHEIHGKKAKILWYDYSSQPHPEPQEEDPYLIKGVANLHNYKDIMVNTVVQLENKFSNKSLCIYNIHYEVKGTAYTALMYIDPRLK